MKLPNLTRSFLFKILASYVLLISLIIIILSTILYFSFTSIGTKIVTESILDRLYQTSCSTVYLQDASFGVIAQVYLDEDITEVLSTKGLEDTELYRLKDKLQRIVNASNFVDSISIYNGTGNNFFSTKDYPPESEKEYLFKYVNDKKRNDELGSGLRPIPRIITGTLIINKKEPIPVYSYIMYNNYKGDARPEKAIILNVKESWVRNVIKSAGANYLGNVIILNQDGIVMSHTLEEMFLKNLSDQDYVKRVFNSGNSGYFIADVDNVRSLVSFVSSDQIGWKFISVLPYSTVVADIQHIRNNIFLVGVFIFFLGITLSYFAARKVSFPIFNLKKKVVEFISSGDNVSGDIELITTGVNEAAAKLRTLESMKKKKAVLEKEVFMRSLLLDLKDYKNEMTDVKNNLSINLECPMMVIIFKIDSFNELKNNSDTIDWNLLKFAIYNIACEILSTQYAVEAVDTGEDHVTLLINTVSEEQNTEEDIIQPYFKEIQKVLMEYFKLSISIASGCITNNAEELSDSYKETLRNFEYRLILGHQSIITYSYVMSAQEKEYVFPENMEKNMIEDLKLCRKEQAEQIFTEIVNHAIEHGINALHSAIIRLAITISNTAKTIKLYYADKFTNMDVNILVRRINQMETLDEITAFFKEYFLMIIEVLDERRSNKTTILINDVKKYIESNYTDPNLSLKSIADLHHITAAYLGKLFKENVGESVSEYINKTRLKEALKLLSETSIPINEIIEKTGNSSTLFFRCFRKAFAITPNEYRKKMQNPGLKIQA